jgi:hypothetical protein
MEEVGTEKLSSNLLGMTIMKNFLTWITIFLFLCGSALAQTPEITALITVTNATKITNAQSTITVNGTARTWTNIPAFNLQTSIAFTNNGYMATTNLITAFQLYSAKGAGGLPVYARTNSSNSFRLVGSLGDALTVTATPDYSTVSYSTNYYTNSTPIRMPFGLEPNQVRSNLMSALLSSLATYATNAVPESTVPFSNYVSLTATQFVVNKIITNATLDLVRITNASVQVTNGTLTNVQMAVVNQTVTNQNVLKATITNANIAAVAATITNLQALGGYDTNRFYDKGFSTNQTLVNVTSFSGKMLAPTNGVFERPTNHNAWLTGTNYIYDSVRPTLAFTNDNAFEFDIYEDTLGLLHFYSWDAVSDVGYFDANGFNVTNLYVFSQIRMGGHSAIAYTGHILQIGNDGNWYGTYIYGSNNMNVGSSILMASFDTNAINFRVNETNANAVSIGNLWVTGTLAPASVSNLTTTAGSTNIVRGSVDFPAASNSNPANGNNAGVILGTNVYIKLSGPSTIATFCGFAAERDGSYHIVEITGAVTNVIANQSGTDPTAANRIVTGTGGDLTCTNNPTELGLIYNASVSRWRVLWRSN